ncbi:hypothetical protein M3689_11765 [Alkalihalophilus marmarensis]|jgi:hypothetical protein|uniref:hypothetical protein n=1 Tax=Alkalihalophilus marmarensis TaxID=521377 RepID=UPI0020411746|nr:hypothetical protein [Alkalihalophilus marmarensis]MCM3489986.1 hypothetical protein [Alkalihalophilus marmarensis]
MEDKLKNSKRVIIGLIVIAMLLGSGLIYQQMEKRSYGHVLDHKLTNELGAGLATPSASYFLLSEAIEQERISYEDLWGIMTGLRHFIGSVQDYNHFASWLNRGDPEWRRGLTVSAADDAFYYFDEQVRWLVTEAEEPIRGDGPRGHVMFEEDYMPREQKLALSAEQLEEYTWYLGLYEAWYEAIEEVIDVPPLAEFDETQWYHNPFVRFGTNGQESSFYDDEWVEILALLEEKTERYYEEAGRLVELDF